MKSLGLGHPKVHRISPNVYAITGLYHAAGGGFGVNAGIILTHHSVVFIDSGMSIAAGEFLWKTACEQMKGQEALYLILTHHHSDHVFGMRVLRDKGAKVIAQETVREFLDDDEGRYKRFIMERYGLGFQGDEILGDVGLSLPDQLIVSDTVLEIDGERIELLFTPGHVPSEISIYHPASRTLFAGDTVYEGTLPTTRFGGPTEWRTWISQLERLTRLDIDIICPGHGNLCSTEEIERNIAYLRTMCAQSNQKTENDA